MLFCMAFFAQKKVLMIVSTPVLSLFCLSLFVAENKNCHRHRNDDDVATYGVRYQTYLNDTAPLINYYQDKGVLRHVDGNKSKDSVTALEKS